MRTIEIACNKLLFVNRTAAIGTAEVVGAVALVVTTFTVPVFVDMALAWQVLAVFMSIKDGNRLYSEAGF